MSSPKAPITPARAAALRRRLLAWYDASRRDLPWRVAQHGADPYRVWLAEAMLQQTQVARVVPYYRRFLEDFPTLEALAAASEEAVLARWSGLGYYARARALRRAAQEALSRHGGLPASVEALRALPGFGPYTAGAVASIAFAIPAAAVDGNVARVLARLALVAGDPAAAPVRRRLQALAGALVDPARPGDWNQALMELGATLCVKPAPRCERCPVAPLCEARRAGRERSVPPARRRPRRRPLLVACAVVERRGRLLLARREGEGLFGGLWGLPDAEVRGVEARAGRALADRVEARHGVLLRVGEEVARVRRTLSHRDLELVAFRCDVGKVTRSSDLRWCRPEETARLGVSAATSALLARIPPRRPPLRSGREEKTRGALGKSPDFQ